jgi:hypothetical protein
VEADSKRRRFRRFTSEYNGTSPPIGAFACQAEGRRSPCLHLQTALAVRVPCVARAQTRVTMAQWLVQAFNFQRQMSAAMRLGRQGPARAAEAQANGVTRTPDLKHARYGPAAMKGPA